MLTETAWRQYFLASPAPKLAVIRTGAWDRHDAKQQRNFEAQLAAFRPAGEELTEVDNADTGAMAQYEAARIYRELVAAHFQSMQCAEPVTDRDERGLPL